MKTATEKGLFWVSFVELFKPQSQKDLVEEADPGRIVLRPHLNARHRSTAKCAANPPVPEFPCLTPLRPVSGACGASPTKKGRIRVTSRRP